MALEAALLQSRTELDIEFNRPVITGTITPTRTRRPRPWPPARHRGRRLHFLAETRITVGPGDRGRGQAHTRSRVGGGVMSNLGPIDQQLLQIVTAAQPANIPDVIQVMEAIDALLPNDDGLKWFNKLYLMVTQQIDGQPPATAWSNGAWLTQLDVVFAGYYFAAIESY